MILFQHDFDAVLKSWLSAPLYNAESGDAESLVKQVKLIRAFTGKHETYCPACKKDSLFQIQADPIAVELFNQQEQHNKLLRAIPAGGGVAMFSDQNAAWVGPFLSLMRCTRVESHVIRMYMHLNVTTKVNQNKLDENNLPTLEKTYSLVKCGQWPSLVDFKLHEIEDVSGAFSDAELREWKRSLMTQAHGFYVAACVHLRRMFESILDDARDSVDNAAHKGKAWPEFDGARGTADRVKLVATELPTFIVEHPQLYAVLSIGVHELTEDECARELPVLQRCMHLIADQRLERQRRVKNEAEVKRLLSESASRLGVKKRE